MAMISMVRLRYIGVIPQTKYMEYGFRIEDKDKGYRLVVLMIESGFFQRHELMFQEAPDLCYQKLLTDLDNESAEFPINSRLSVTSADIAYYRQSHPTGKSHKPRRNPPE
jgi:hypothetical protein